MGPWQPLGDAAGSKRRRRQPLRIDPGRLSTPPHSHKRAEEIFFVLGGSGLCGRTRRCARCARATRSSTSPTARSTRSRAGPDGLDVLAFGTRHRSSTAGCRARRRCASATLDRGPRRRPVGHRGRGRRARVRGAGRRGRRTSSRSRTSRWTRTATASVGRGLRLGSVRAKWSKRGPNAELAIPHCHSAEEEAFVVLEGDGTLELWPSPRRRRRRRARDASDPCRAT